MKTGFILSVVLLVTALQFLAYSSAQCEQNENTGRPKIALILAKPPDDDPTKKIIEKVPPVEVEEAVVPVQDNASDHFNRGAAHDNSGMYSEAIEAYKNAIRIRPDYPEAHFNLALSYLMSNDSDSAHKEYMLLKNIDPHMAANLYTKALLIVRSDSANKYVIQAGAFRNVQNADDMIDKLKANYLHAHIETEAGFNKVRIFGIKNKEDADFLMKDINDKFKISPFIVPAR